MLLVNTSHWRIILQQIQLYVIFITMPLSYIKRANKKILHFLNDKSSAVLRFSLLVCSLLPKRYSAMNYD